MMAQRNVRDPGGLRLWLLLAGVVLAQALGSAQPAPPATAPGSPGELLQRLKPLPASLKGWTLAPNPPTATGQTAGNLLPPPVAAAAGAFRLEWVVQLAFTPDNPRASLTVEVLHFADPLDAYGAFAQLRSRAAVAAEQKTLSAWTGDQLLCWRDEFTLRVTPPGTGQAAHAAAGLAAEAILGLMPAPRPLPLMMRLMPEGRLAPNTLRYYRTNLLGQLPLGDALVANYVENGTELQLALVRQGSDQAAREAYCNIANLLAPGTCGSPLSQLGREAQIIQTRQFGTTYLMNEGRYLVMALNVHDHDTAEGLLRITATNIRIVR